MMTPNELYDILWMNIMADSGEHYTDDYYLNSPLNFFSELVEGCEDVEVYDGATKICLVPDDGDFVFKINIIDDDGIDYCKYEADNYQEAVKAGKGKYFLETRYFKTLNECGVCFAIYIQPKIEEISSEIDSDSDEVINISPSYYSSPAADRLSPTWIHNFIEAYGESEYFSLLDFCNKTAINDLHSGNIGYIDNHPVIFDYAGYFDGSSSWDNSLTY